MRVGADERIRVKDVDAVIPLARPDSFGDILQVLFIFFCLYPVFSFVSLIIWYAGMDFEQTFSTRMPVKGEKIDYRLMIFNRSFLPLVQPGASQG